jgi:hypothetical protein
LRVEDNCVHTPNGFKYASQTNQGTEYSVAGAVWRVFLALITFSAQFYLCFEVIWKFNFFGTFEVFGYIFANAQVVQVSLFLAQLMLVALIFRMLGSYILQSPAGFIKSERRKKLGVTSKKFRRGLLEIAIRVVDKQSKFLANFNFPPLQSLVKLVIAKQGRSKEHFNQLFMDSGYSSPEKQLSNTVVFLNTHIHIKALVQLALSQYISVHEEGTSGKDNHAAYAQEMDLGVVDILDSARMQNLTAADSMDQIQEELVCFIRKWVNNKSAHCAFFEYMYSRETIGQFTDSYFENRRLSGYTLDRACNKGEITSTMQEKVATLFHFVQRRLFRQMVIQSRGIKDYDASLNDFLHMTQGLANDFEHEIIKMFPAQQPWYIRICHAFAGNLGQINAIANSVMFSCIFYDLLLKLSDSVIPIPLPIIYSFFAFAMASGYYMSISFTFQNVKKFINGLKFKKIPMYLNSDKGRLNVFLGVMMGLASGVFCYNKVMKLLCDLNGPIFGFMKLIQADAFYLAHLGTFGTVFSIALSVVTFLCAAMLYANQCLKSQRSSYDYTSWREWFGQAFKSESLSVRNVLLLGGAIIQASMFQVSLFALPWLAVLGAGRWVVIGCVVFIWKQLFSNALDKMEGQLGLRALTTMFDKRCYMSFSMTVSSDPVQNNLNAVNDAVSSLKTEGSTTYQI